MAFKDKLPVSYLLFTNRGRISRLAYWMVSVFIWSTFYVLFKLMTLINDSATFFIYPLLFWTLIATATKRLHDSDHSSKWLLLVFIPVIGPAWLFFLLGFKKGSENRIAYGGNPLKAPDYFKNNVVGSSSDQLIVDDVTQLNPIKVSSVVIPDSISELQQIIQTSKYVSVGGGRFSMGGQTASPSSVHIDMRRLNKILEFSKEGKTIKVEAGTRWCDIQHYVDLHGLSVKIMQTYANFTVGGALSVNCHGRYIGLGPLILSVKSLEIILADGTLKLVSRTQNPELFYATVGCYNAIAVIATAEFELEDNLTVERNSLVLKASSYADYFVRNVRDNAKVVFHNGDVYPPKYESIRAVSWVKTDRKPTEQSRMMPLAAAYPLERYFIGAFSKSKFGKWRRQYIYDPMLFFKKKVHWRNYEAGYDVAELEPKSRKNTTYVLQEYFVPVDQFDVFRTQMAGIFDQHDVNVINVSIRHALPDDGSLLAWAKQEVFAFVIWYKQSTDLLATQKVGEWTRELTDAAIATGGSYYLPYQVHATPEQFAAAYPKAKQLMQLKHELDPDYKFRNILWDTYYQP